MKALVVGGTGPTGPHVVNGLLSRGFEVAILHTGRHEVDTIPPTVEHLHTNPFDVDKVADCLGGRTFDVVYSMYGRLRALAPFFAGRCGRFVAVGGVPAYRGYARPQYLWPTGLLAPVREDAERAVDDENVKVARIVATEDVVFDAHPDATMFRYPQIYGPGQIIPREWMIVRRVLDGRRRVIVADGGLTLRTVGYSANVAQALVLTVDHLEAVGRQGLQRGRRAHADRPPDRRGAGAGPRPRPRDRQPAHGAGHPGPAVHVLRHEPAHASSASRASATTSATATCCRSSRP